MNKMSLQIGLSIMLISFRNIAVAQSGYTISGKVSEANSGKPMQNATVHLKGSGFSTLSKMDGAFRVFTNNWYGSLEITNVGFETFTISLQKGRTNNLTVSMKNKSDS